MRLRSGAQPERRLDARERDASEPGRRKKTPWGAAQVLDKARLGQGNGDVLVDGTKPNSLIGPILSAVTPHGRTNQFEADRGPCNHHTATVLASSAVLVENPWFGVGRDIFGPTQRESQAHSSGFLSFPAAIFFGFEARATTANARSKSAGSLLVSASRAASRMRLARSASVGLAFLAGMPIT